MEQQLLTEALSRHVDLTLAEMQLFMSALQPRRLKAKEVLLQPGEICRHSAFVLKGCLRSYSVDREGVEHILGFAAAGWWMADMYSLLSQKPGTLCIDALKTTEILLLAKNDQERLYVQIPKLERFFRILTENALVANQQRLLDNLGLSAKERFLKFCTAYPGLIDIVSQKHVAAYIGVTPEFLSKLRRQLGR